MLPEPKDDHELLLVVYQVVQGLERDVRSALGQLQRGNDRFQQIALKEQQHDTAISELRSSVAGGLRAAEIAQEAARQAQATADAGLRAVNRVEFAINGEKGLTATVTQLGTVVAELQTTIHPVAEIAPIVTQLQRESDEQKTRSQLIHRILSPGGALVMAVVIALVTGLLTHWLWP